MISLVYIVTQTTLEFPDDVVLPEAAKTLIQQLLCDKSVRLGVDGIKTHPFFASIDWDTLHTRLRFNRSFRIYFAGNINCFQTNSSYKFYFRAGAICSASEPRRGRVELRC